MWGAVPLCCSVTQGVGGIAVHALCGGLSFKAGVKARRYGDGGAGSPPHVGCGSVKGVTGSG